jgi:hypothetical protein
VQQRLERHDDDAEPGVHQTGNHRDRPRTAQLPRDSDTPQRQLYDPVGQGEVDGELRPDPARGTDQQDDDGQARRLHHRELLRHGGPDEVGVQVPLAQPVFEDLCVHVREPEHQQRQHDRRRQPGGIAVVGAGGGDQCGRDDGAVDGSAGIREQPRAPARHPFTISCRWVRPRGDPFNCQKRPRTVTVAVHRVP